MRRNICAKNGEVKTVSFYDAANQLLTQKDSTGTTTYSFDANGNQARKTAPGGARTTWLRDYENRLTSVQLSTGVRDTFAYNGDGQRVQRQDSSGTTDPIWDQQNVLLETDQNGVTQALYTLEPAAYGNLLSQYRGGASQFYLCDGLGSTDRLADSNANVTDSYVYQAFGVIWTSSGTSTNPFRYVGRLGYYYDPDLVQYYLRARHYDPSLGRFLSQDPVGFGRGNPNTFFYVANNPAGLVDPSGLVLDRLWNALVLPGASTRDKITPVGPEDAQPGGTLDLQDLMIVTCISPIWENEGGKLNWLEQCTARCGNRIGTSKPECPKSFKMLCDMIERTCARFKMKKKFSRIFILGHCGAPNHTDPGVLLGRDGLRLDKSTIGTEAAKCLIDAVANGLRPGGIVVLCSCGYAGPQGGAQRTKWLDDLLALAVKLRQRVCACAVAPDVNSPAIGCNCKEWVCCDGRPGAKQECR